METYRFATSLTPTSLLLSAGFTWLLVPFYPSTLPPFYLNSIHQPRLEAGSWRIPRQTQHCLNPVSISSTLCLAYPHTHTSTHPQTTRNPHSYTSYTSCTSATHFLNNPNNTRILLSSPPPCSGRVAGLPSSSVNGWMAVGEMGSGSGGSGSGDGDRMGRGE